VIQADADGVRMKKASANMWWIIIGAVIALVVMIVLMVMFTRQSGGVEIGLLDCESKGGTCQYSTPQECREVGKGTTNPVFKCSPGYPQNTPCCFGAEKTNT
jgi:hypothetical protein